jgi:hypothetical protein
MNQKLSLTVYQYAVRFIHKVCYFLSGNFKFIPVIYHVGSSSVCGKKVVGTFSKLNVIKELSSQVFHWLRGNGPCHDIIVLCESNSLFRCLWMCRQIGNLKVSSEERKCVCWLFELFKFPMDLDFLSLGFALRNHQKPITISSSKKCSVCLKVITEQQGCCRASNRKDACCRSTTRKLR